MRGDSNRISTSARRNIGAIASNSDSLVRGTDKSLILGIITADVIDIPMRRIIRSKEIEIIEERIAGVIAIQIAVR